MIERINADTCWWIAVATPLISTVNIILLLGGFATIDSKKRSAIKFEPRKRRIADEWASQVYIICAFFTWQRIYSIFIHIIYSLTSDSRCRMKNNVSAVSGDIPFAADGERNESSATWTERLLIIFHVFFPSIIIIETLNAICYLPYERERAVIWADYDLQLKKLHTVKQHPTTDWIKLILNWNVRKNSFVVSFGLRSPSFIT